MSRPRQAAALPKPKLAFDPVAAQAHLRANDATIGALIDRVGSFELELKPAASLFEALLRSIVYQQLHGKAAATILARVVAALAANGGTTPAAAELTSDAVLRGAGLSRNKLLAVRELAAKCRDGTVPSLAAARQLDDGQLIDRLTAVRGIGPWTVHMLLIFYLGRPDVMPTGDFAIRLAFKRLFRKRLDPKPEAIIRHARKWQPYRSVASWYLWRSLDDA